MYQKIKERLMGAAIRAWRRQSFRPQQYWESRHADYHGSIKAVGHMGLNEEENDFDYAQKVAALKKAIVGLTGKVQNSSLLDCGCGTGAFSSVFEDLGFAVTGVDFSETAISQAQERLKGKYVVGDLSGIELDECFDWVVCIDVLFHVVDDHKWKKTLMNLGRHVSSQGYLLIQEHLKETNERHTDHVKWRTFDSYAKVFEEMGFTVSIEREYQLANEGVHKHILLAKRTARA